MRLLAGLLAGEPAEPDQIASLPDGWRRLVERVADGATDGRVARFEAALSEMALKDRERADRTRAAVFAAGMADRANGHDVDVSADVDDGWEEPVWFGSSGVPAFPVETLPPGFREYAEGLAQSTQTPVDLPASMVLAALAACCARLVNVRAWPGWIEPTPLFVLAVLPPASRKSAVFSAVFEPFHAAERDLSTIVSPLIASAKSTERMLQGRLREAEQGAVKSEDAVGRGIFEDEARKLAALVAEHHTPEPPRLLCDDITPERIVGHLANSGSRLLIAASEGALLFSLMAGKYTSSGAPSFEIYLKGHAGDALVVDRMGRPSEVVERPALTLAVTGQPHVLTGLASKASFRGLGLLARFIYVIPESNIGRRQIRPAPMPPGTVDLYEARISGLLALFRPDDGGVWPETQTLDLTAEAQTVLEAFARTVERRLGDDGDLATLSDWAGKLVGLVLRLAAILHVGDHAHRADPWRLRIDAETIRRAVKIGSWAEGHAVRAFEDMGASEEVEQAKRVLRWIEQHEPPLTTFTRRDAHQGLRSVFRRAEEIDAPLEMLAERGFIRETATPARDERRGRPPSPLFAVNPLTYAHKTQFTQKSARSRNSEYFEVSEWQPEHLSVADDAAEDQS